MNVLESLTTAYLSNHQDLVRLGKLGKLLERRHQALIVVPAASRVDEDNVKALLGRKGNGVLGNSGGILAVALLVELDLAALSSCQLFEVPYMDSELLDGTGSERVAGRDEHLVLVLKEEEANLGQVGRLAHAVDAHNGDDVGTSFAQ